MGGVQSDCWCICLCYLPLAPKNPEDMQENFRGKGSKLYFGFVDLEKAVDNVPREVIMWQCVSWQ